jgi:hypothetical protein
MLPWETLTGGDGRFRQQPAVPMDCTDRMEYASFLKNYVAACRFSTDLANGRPTACASSSLLADLASDLSHRSGQFLNLNP